MLELPNGTRRKVPSIRDHGSPGAKFPRSPRDAGRTLIGAGLSHAARAAHVPRSRDPDPCEGDAGLLR